MSHLAQWVFHCCGIGNLHAHADDERPSFALHILVRKAMQRESGGVTIVIDVSVF